MNWFTHSHHSTGQVLIEYNDSCVHMDENLEQPCVLSKENDSFGFEGYLMCIPCWEKAQAEVAEELCGCRDCKKQVPRGEGIEWRWYDFYAPQGDEAMFICGDCTKLDKHLQRVAKDRRDRDIELGNVSYFDDDEDEYDYDYEEEYASATSVEECPADCKELCCDFNND